ncbi:RagB/SusD family nutrient uptake outer membrane protein [Dysgonomonas sp. 25]|uniref:RagB/SusD family nutrient uptake outer membrane protein n=1 Tax=Dysgonomonas sp. 25 TaxID=2302933 RepID=UPI0013D5C0CF|nr:RagB/SusD family nutrient uptake outer membrane protein [Dysgonomonas sp. 25]NDV68244.1 RagB/SusD family nutrient uptake outer membrane protein [Dysgonomonas sp. 25]
MKKNILKLATLFVCGVVSFSFTGCIDETHPTTGATQDQLASSNKATEALLWAMPAYANTIETNTGSHYELGYPAMMRIRDVMTEEAVVASSGYDKFTNWKNNQYLDDGRASTQYIWNYYWKFVLTSNNMIGAIDPTSASETQLGYLGVGHAFRAFLYLDMAQMFEFLPNDRTTSPNAAGNDILNLTVPIVTETMGEAEARNNPRVPRQQMYEFILSDLDKAEDYIQHFTPRLSKTLPDLSVIYGLKARLYMWVEDYPNAKLYARKAIDTGLYTPTTKAQWMSATNGFNDISIGSWMWGSSLQKEDLAVKRGISNWTSWASNEALYGYASAGPFYMIDARTYSRISNDDFRKLSWKAPAGSALDGQNVYIDPTWAATNLPTYASTKFRPGAGNTKEFSVGSSCSYPLMRIEEMYFIEAEAAEHVAAGQGKALLETFMQTYRYVTYTCTAGTQDDVIQEIIFQKRIELWGEGLNFFDYKRLNLSVNRGYTGTNHSEVCRFNTTTRPAWMNFCIVLTEKNNNSALVGYENPDPSDLYVPWQ